MMKNLSDIIINPISCDKVKEMYLNDEITEGEYYLLMASRGELKDSLREVYIKNFLVGCAEYKLYYEDIDENLYFTNIEEVLASFYSLYEKLPNYNFDQVLKFMLNKLSPNQGYLYEILTIIYYQIMNEEKNFSPFKIITREMLENCRECLFRMKDIYKDRKWYDAANRENGYMDVIGDYNKDFKDKIDFDMLDFEESKKVL